MKRGAENYMTKDFDHNEDEEEESGDGFRKAEDAVLATRKIRALPKRVGGSPAPAPNTNGNGITDEHPPSSPKFGGFTGFGSPSNSFTFATPPPQSLFSPPTSAQPISSGSSFSFPPSSPTVAPTASNTAKTFASFIADSSSSKPAAPSPKSPPPSSEHRGDAEDSAALKYYTSLRGLNVSFLAALSLAVEKDPFTDVTTVLDRYKSLRSTVQTEFNGRPSNSTDPLPSASSVPSLKPSSVPAPPTFAGFSTLGSSSSSASSSGFSFPPPSSTSGASSGTSAFPATTTGTSTNTSTVFGTSSSASTSTPFGTSPFNPTGASPFGSSSTPGFNSNSFGNSSSSASNLFGADKPAPSSSFFGTAQSSSTSSSKPSPFGSFGGFGKPAGGVGSLGNPVGFGFGSPPRTPEGDGNGSSGSKSGASSDAAESRNGESNEATPQPDGDDAVTPALLGNNPHDEEGEGEEQEDTVYSIKLRAFRLKKAEEKGGSGWAELGYGVLRLKKHKETEARRMLLRNSSTGKININFNLYSGLKPSQTKKAITFVGHGDGVSQTYSVRLQSEEQAAKLKEALEKEIVLVKSSGNSS